jgi:tetraacyldisaccharide 4'-kinase
MKIYNRESTSERIFRGGGLWSVLLPLRVILSFLYGIILRVRRIAPKRQARITQSATAANIISVGNLVVGGGGKTPCAIALAEAMKKRGIAPVILTRGYGSRAEKAGRPVIAGPAAEYARSSGYLTENDFELGEEPGMRYASVLGDEVAIYRKLGIPVVIDPDRGRGAIAASAVYDPDFLIMDDGFQNFSVEKNYEILLLDQSNPFGKKHLLPWGTLREMPEAAERADAVVFTRSVSDKVPEEAQAAVKGSEIFFARHRFGGIYDREEREIPPAEFVDRTVAIYSGIAVPGSFEQIFIDNVAEPEFSFRFTDHHSYGAEDVDIILEKCGSGSAIVTTEKDWFKSMELFPSGTDIYRMRIDMKIDGLGRLIDIITGD